MFASFLLLRLESMFFIEQIKKNYIYLRIPKKCHAIFETKMCSDLMAATFMDFIKFGLDRKDLSQWPDNRLNDICVKNSTQSSKIFKIFPKELGNFGRKYSVIKWRFWNLEFMAWFEVRFVCHYLETPYLCTYDVINWVLSDNQSMYNASIKLCTLIGYITNYD